MTSLPQAVSDAVEKLCAEFPEWQTGPNDISQFQNYKAKRVHGAIHRTAEAVVAIMERKALFVRQDFTSHSGQPLTWKIECDALTDADIETLAFMISERLSPFGKVIGIPRGGLRIAGALEQYQTEGPLLVVDDVLTTGVSFVPYTPKHLQQDTIGAVIFARGPCPSWITPLFQLDADPIGNATGAPEGAGIQGVTKLRVEATLSTANRKWYATRKESPSFCFEGNSLGEVAALAQRALELYQGVQHD